MREIIKKIGYQNILLLGVLLICVVAIFALVVFIKKEQQTPHAMLAPHIQMSTLELNVSNYNDMEDFYTKMLGMQVIKRETISVLLGFGKLGVLKLNKTPNLPLSAPQDPGLDQIAIVFSSRPGLAKALKRITDVNPALYAGGTSRGAVGEAFYVTDPQGNSLELYYDTDPSTWPRTVKGNVEGQSNPIDINKYLNQYAGLEGDSSMKIGHLQVRIGDITTGRQFYLNTVGFYAVPSLIQSDSTFMSDGYYHHDLVISQAQNYDGDMIDRYSGLKGFSMMLPNATYVDKLKKRLTAAGVPFKENDKSITFADPWGIKITVGSNNSWRLW
jgi:catechol 2,3-dioxygenase